MELNELLSKYIEDKTKLEAAVTEINQDLAKSFIPKGRFNEINEELKASKAQLDETKKAMETLSTKANSVEEYEKKLADLQTANKEIEEKANKQISSITTRSQLKELLLTNNAHKDAIDLLVDKYADSTVLEKGVIKDSDKLLETIKKDKAGLFIEKKEDSVDKGGSKETKTDDDTARLRNLYGLK